MNKLEFIHRFKSGMLTRQGTSKIIDHMLDSSDFVDRKNAAGSRYATQEHLDKAMNDDHAFVIEAAVNNPKASKEHLDKAIEMQHFDFIRESVAKHPNATKEHLDKALKDTNRYVRWAARKNKNYKTYYPNGIEDEPI